MLKCRSYVLHIIKSKQNAAIFILSLQITQNFEWTTLMGIPNDPNDACPHVVARQGEMSNILAWCSAVRFEESNEEEAMLALG